MKRNIELQKIYLVQCLNYAASYLRLNKPQLDTLNYMCNFLNDSEELFEVIVFFSKVTELSSLSIRLKEIYNFITYGKIDYSKISETFKKQANDLIQELNSALKCLSTDRMKEIVHAKDVLFESETDENAQVESEKTEALTTNKDEYENNYDNKIKVEYNDSDNSAFKLFEMQLVEEVKCFDIILQKLYQNEIDLIEIKDCISKVDDMKENCLKFGLETVAEMHEIFQNSLSLILKNTIPVTKELIESMRSCLIVIVAVVRNKNIDIAYYYSRTEILSKQINYYFEK